MVMEQVYDAIGIWNICRLCRHIISIQFLFTVMPYQFQFNGRQMPAQAIRKSVHSEFSNLKYQTSGFIENLVNSSLYML